MRITLLLSCNPNTIELLGLKKEHYLNSFGGYADAQLRRLQNALARDSYPQSEREQHIFNSVRNAMHDFNRQYQSYRDGSIEIFIDHAENPDFDTEIFVNADLKHYPLRDYAGMWNTMANVVKDYDKIGKRAVESGSRSGGFASSDSDYDVRFIYVRDRNSYLGLREMKDFLDWEMNDVLDMNGWDLKILLCTAANFGLQVDRAKEMSATGIV